MLTKIKGYLIENDIPEEDAEIAVYGIYRAILLLVGILVALILGMIFGSVKHTILFLIFFMPLRVFAGGYHANSIWKCGLLSSFIILLANLLLDAPMDSGRGIMLFIIILSASLHFMFAPQDNSNRRLFSWERMRFKKICNSIVLLYLVLTSASFIFGWGLVLHTICVVMSFSGISLVIALIKNDRLKK